MPVEKLASHQRFESRLQLSWPAFQHMRRERLRQHGRYGDAAEHVTENIVEDLLTIALDWKVGDITNQVGYADILVTRLGIKYCVVEVKRPGSLAWNQTAVQQALSQARRYADEQKVKCIAVSDGVMLYAADIVAGGLKDRIFVSLESEAPPLDLWWLSEHGIYRPRRELNSEGLTLLRPAPEGKQSRSNIVDLQLLHPKYALPSSSVSPMLAMPIGLGRGSYRICSKTARLMASASPRRSSLF